jgi:hypothetical protein
VAEAQVPEAVYNLAAVGTVPLKFQSIAASSNAVVDLYFAAAAECIDPVEVVVLAAVVPRRAALLVAATAAPPVWFRVLRNTRSGRARREASDGHLLLEVPWDGQKTDNCLRLQNGQIPR